MNTVIALAMGLLGGCFILLIAIYMLLLKIFWEVEGIYNRLIDLIKKR